MKWIEVNSVEDIKSNPYRTPEAAPVDGELIPSSIARSFTVVSWVCSIIVACYGFLGSIANGLDLLRTHSRRDMMTEVRLLSILLFGIVIGWLTYFVQKRRRTGLIILVAMIATVGFLFIFRDRFSSSYWSA